MRSLQQLIREGILGTQEQNTGSLPLWLRNLLRSTSGGDEWSTRFIRGLFWKYRWMLSLALVANIGAGFAEAATLGIFTLALSYITSVVSHTSYDTSGAINSLVLQLSQFAGVQQPILIMLGLAVIFQLARSLLDFGGQAASILVRVWLEGDLQRRIFTQLVQVRYEQISQNRLGNLASYNSQAQEIGSLIAVLNLSLNHLIFIVAYTAVLFWLSWQFTIVALIGLLLLSFSLHSLRENIRASMVRFVDISVRLNERILEYLQGLRIVHIFVREQTAVNEVTGLVDASIRSRRNALIRGAAILPIMQSITIVGIALLLGIGFWVVIQNNTAFAATLATYIFVIYRLMPRIAGFNSEMGRATAQWPYLIRIAELLNPAGKEFEYRPGKAINALGEGIEFREVTLRYPGSEHDAVKNLNFRINPGTMVALVGTSGSGKSSIINLLLGINRPTTGQILVDGVDLSAYDLALWRQSIGVVDQETLIFSTSVAENIRFGKIDASDEEVSAAAKVAHADNFIQDLPLEYQTEVGDRGHRLSGGQRQRIAIARAIIHQPALLLFDEATSALDSQSEKLIQESLEELRKERTIVAVAHRLSTVAKADQIIVMDNGQVMEQGTHQALLEENGRYAAMWRLQAGGAGIEPIAQS